MSNQQDYEKVLPEMKKIPFEDLENPNMPVKHYIQEAEDLDKAIAKHRQELMGAGLAQDVIDRLLTGCGALRQAESNWHAIQFEREEAMKQYKNEAPEAYDLQNLLAHHFRFAYRKNDVISRRLKKIADGSGHSDMIQDLSDYYTIGTQNPDPLKKIGFDLTLLQKAADISDSLASLYSTAKSEDASKESLEMRNRAYTYLKYIVDEIREHGRYVFWQDEAKQKIFRSAYHVKRRKKATQQNVAQDA